MAEKKNAKVVKYASRGQWRDLVRELDKGASVNATDGKRRSALFLAALNGKKKCLKELLRRGADPNQYVHSHVILFISILSPGGRWTDRQPAMLLHLAEGHRGSPPAL